jgi:hypothetical protein
MNTFQLKILAIIFMFIDHMGLFLFPQYFLFRIIGRLAFPLFAWLIANGAYHTHNIGKYVQRLYLFALISQIPFFLANHLIDPHFSELNVLCTLFFGLVAICIIQRTSNRVYWFFVTAVFASIAQFLQTDYGGFGVVSIVLYYVFYANFRRMVIAQILLFFAPFILFPDYLAGLFEPFGLLSLIFIRLYNNQQGISAKYLFYIIYPVQYLVFYFLLLRLSAMPI